MCSGVVGLPQATWLLRQLAIQSRQASGPMATVRVPLAAPFGVQVQLELRRVRLGRSLGEASSLGLEQTREAFSFHLAHTGKIRLHLREAFGDAVVKDGKKIADVLVYVRLDAGDTSLTSRVGAPQRLIELVKGPFFGLPLERERAERLSTAISVSPNSGDRDHLLMEARGIGAIDGQAGQKHDARLDAFTADDRDA